MSVTETGPRAREPDGSGYAEAVDGLRLYWEVHGGGSTTIVLLPANPISHSRLWKAQVHYLARRYRVLAYDGPGNGRADAADPSLPWLESRRPSDCLSVMDATGTDAAVLVGICGDGVWPSVQIAAQHPQRVLGLVAIAPGVPLLAPPLPQRAESLATFEESIDNPQGWQKFNRRYIRENHRDFLEFFFGEMFPEPHSEKQLEDAVAYGLDGPVEALLPDVEVPVGTTKEEVEEVCRRVRCPVLVLQGDRDNCQSYDRGLALAELTGGEHVRLAGSGHIPMARHPVAVNLLIDGFAARFDGAAPQRRTWVWAGARPKRVLMVSSPIGLGHAWRDVAIARELRRLAPELEVEWLAQAPVTRLLEACGETIHPASAQLAPEAAGVDAHAGEHALHAFDMLRRLDEIFCANFMVFNDVVREERFDVWIADEAWEIDYFLHENPELKTAPYVWLTDFVGVLPMNGDEREAFLAADHNAQMVEHVARNPRLRDRSIFIGDRDDIVAGRLGPALPSIRDWTERHFEFAGYVTGFEPEEIADRDGLRAELGYGPDEKVCVVAPGGSGVGVHLLQRVVEAFPAAKALVPALRMVVVAGPRIDPELFPHSEGLEAHGYVHRLYRQLAACDVAITHGGLSTTMELTAAGRPFLTFPLRDHFEQNHHVAHRLARHGAGRRMSYADDGPDAIAAAIAEEIDRVPAYRPVARDGAARVARAIAELL
jgi:pimeloyl-ACP methyl ester carboxylesterase/spore coat polysaccharide biosynthesis predicted glycosyltransferase SpsG